MDINAENRPGILLIGNSNVGKRTLLSKLLSLDLDDASFDSSSQVVAHGWTIDTKYYTADVSIWMAHLHDGFSIASHPVIQNLAALVMVFDITDLSSLVALQDWVTYSDVIEKKKFDVLLCIGNKVDLLSGHPVHVEYRRRCLKKLGEDSDDPYMEDFGISETEGSSLLGNEEPSWEIRRSCLEWCTNHNIEYIEACASNSDFDKCLSVDGDSQGVERLFGALSAHMWPGMILKSGNQIIQPILLQKQELSEEESEYEFEYEVLSAGSADPWDDTHETWVSAEGPIIISDSGVSTSSHETNAAECDGENGTTHDVLEGVTHKDENKNENASEVDDDKNEMESLEHLMSEIGNMRDNLRLVPDFQRREMAAKLAMKMASMFGGETSDEDEADST